MKAIVYDRYGSLDVLGLRDIEKPAIQADEVLVRVQAAAVHVGDCFAVRGTPFAMRLVSGLLRPKCGIPGFDLSGIVEAVGSAVDTCKPGDPVFGAGKGCCAEYAAVKSSTLAPKPTNLSFAEAAAIPTSGLAALHGIRDTGKLQSGQRVLVIGASGGVGMFAVQIAKSLGAHVCGVCGPRNVEMVRSIGADEVIDYTSQDFADGKTHYDLILDNIENRSLADCRRALTDSGTLVLNSGTGAQGMAMMVRLLRPLLLAPFVRHKLRRYVITPSRENLLVLAQLAQSGKLKPVLAQTYPLSETRAALEHVESGHARGKVVVMI
jgi:NADPH:quinone reductase-like Zn-dependent oxidoreductase